MNNTCTYNSPWYAQNMLNKFYKAVQRWTILVPSTVPDTQNKANKFSSITDITKHPHWPLTKTNGLSHLKPKSVSKKLPPICPVQSSGPTESTCCHLYSKSSFPSSLSTCHWFPSLPIAAVTFPCMWFNLTGKAKKFCIPRHTHPAHMHMRT